MNGGPSFGRRTLFRKLIKFPLESSKQVITIWSSNQVFFVVLCFLIQLGITSLFWNRYIEQYHLLLETPATSDLQAVRFSLLNSLSVFLLFLYVFLFVWMKGRKGILDSAVLKQIQVLKIMERTKGKDKPFLLFIVIHLFLSNCRFLFIEMKTDTLSPRTKERRWKEWIALVWSRTRGSWKNPSTQKERERGKKREKREREK